MMRKNKWVPVWLLVMSLSLAHTGMGYSFETEADDASGEADFSDEDMLSLIDEEDADGLLDVTDDQLMSAEEVARSFQEAERQQQLEEEAALEEVKSRLIENGFDPAGADPQILLETMQNLTAVESPTGSDGELEIGGYIREYMENLGYTVAEQSFHEGFLNENMVDVPGVNIIAEHGVDADQFENEYAGTEDIPDDILIVCAHYDSVTDPVEGDPLANDKTGVAVLLEAARILAGMDFRMDVCFLFLSGEEDGYYGSENFMKKLGEQNAAQIKGVLYIDQIGVSDDAPYVIKTSDGESNSMGENLQAGQRIQQILDRESSIIAAEAEDLQNPFPEWAYEAEESGALSHFTAAGINAVMLRQEAETAAKQDKTVEQSDTEEQRAATGQSDTAKQTAEAEQAEPAEQTENAEQTEEAGPAEDTQESALTENSRIIAFGKSTKEDLAMAKRIARITDIVVRTIGFYMG